ncbi:MAG: choline dehydrogenase [Sphingomonadales bacterium]|nr:choline dehydrogenase [Sphingomonadales bacterium]
MPDSRDYDYIIVGAGSAGCVLAARLSEDPAVRILLIEAGGSDANPMFRIPLGYSFTIKSKRYNWQFPTEPDPATDGRVHHWPRGKVLGGSSSINAMIYMRGNPGDYDGWAQMGLTGWGWADVLPYFKRSEDFSAGADDFHGAGGPLRIEPPAYVHPISQALIAAAGEFGLPRIDDFNRGVQEGAGLLHSTIRNGKRMSTAEAFLKPARQRKNLKVETDALAHAVMFKGKKAVGLRYGKAGKAIEARARREVILSGGAINSPQLLELSGVGDAARLQEAGIEVVHHLPGVGENLQDHFNVGIAFRLKPGTPSINQTANGLPILKELWRYFTARKGLLSVGPAHVTIFARSRAELEWPDLQYHCTAATFDPEAYLNNKLVFHKEPGLTLGHCVLRPESRGAIHVKSSDPAEYPAIAPNYLATETDRRASVAGFRIARKIVSQPALARHVACEFNPGPEVESDDELLAVAREHGGTIYHPVGTAKMGRTDDPMAVVDGELKVIGVEGLRVVDASVMPALVSGNTNAPTIMIAEKAADMVLGRPAPSD